MEKALVGIEKQLEGMTESQKDMIIKELKEKHKTFDTKFLNAMLFPETSPPARWPVKYAPTQTALFTHRAHAYNSTGSNGQGFIGILPKEVRMPCMFSSTHDNSTGASWDGNPTNNPVSNSTFWQTGQMNSDYIVSNYSAIRLVGCSIRIQYIGPVETESGILVGSHLWETKPPGVSEEKIENGYFVHRGKPSDGIRMVWIPKDKSDCDFYSSDVFIRPKTTNTWAPSVGSYKQLTPLEYYGDVESTNELDALNAVTIAGIGDQAFSEGDIARIIGMGQREGHVSEPEMLVAYWRGLPAGNQYWRIDVERHFEGIPRTTIRDIVSTDYPKPNEKTLDLAMSNELHMMPLASHSSREAGFWDRYGKPLIKDMAVGLAGVAGTAFGGPVAGTIAGLGTEKLIGAIFGNDAVQETYNQYRSSEMRGASGLDHHLGLGAQDIQHAKTDNQYMSLMF